MRDTRNRIATGLQASVLVLLVGCGSSPPREDSAVGTVLLPDGTSLAADPAGERLIRPATNLAVILERRNGSTRVLAADGRHGWTTGALPAPAPVTVDCPPASVPLFARSPDDVSPESGDLQPASAPTGTLLGASMTVYPASQRVLMAPPHLQILMPALRVRCGIDGYAPPEWLRIQFSSPAFELVEGLVRRPFVGPAVEELLARRPSPTEPVLAFHEDRLATQPSGVSWSDVEGFYRDADDPTRTFAVYAADGARLYDFSKPPLRLFFPMYTPYPIRVTASPDEWFVEAVSTFGDGAYSTLFHVRRDGSMAFHTLSRSSGELDEDTRASWGLLDNELWIARAIGARVSMSGVQTPLYLAILRTTKQYATPSEPGAGLFPASGDDDWIVGVPFRTEAEAVQHARGRRVERYPE